MRASARKRVRLPTHLRALDALGRHQLRRATMRSCISRECNDAWVSAASHRSTCWENLRCVVRLLGLRNRPASVNSAGHLSLIGAPVGYLQIPRIIGVKNPE